MNREFSCSDKETLIAYLYDECDAADRPLVEAHLGACAACADEVAAFGGVREALAAWTPPATVGRFRLVRDEDLDSTSAPATVLRPARWWRRPLPGWARAAAAVLLFGGGAALANLDVHYGQEGLTVRTGWQHAAPAVARAVPASAAVPVSAPWRSDLTALEGRLRGDFASQLQAARGASPQAVSAQASADDRQIMTRVRAMIDESERRQQSELAYRVAQVQGEVGVQRRADQMKVLQSLGQLQGQTGAEIAQQRQYINYLLTTVSQKK
jgi:anti-sigma factor RsiW